MDAFGKEKSSFILFYLIFFEGWDHFREEKSTFFGEKSSVHFRGKN